MNIWNILTKEYILGGEYGFRWIYLIIAILITFAIMIPCRLIEDKK